MFLDGEVRHRVGRRCSVPMFHAGRAPDDVAGPDFLDRAAPTLRPAKPERDDQGLAERVRVPGGTGAGLERDARAANARRLGRFEQRIHAHIAGEILLRSLLGLLRAVSPDFHRPLRPLPRATRRADDLERATVAPGYGRCTRSRLRLYFPAYNCRVSADSTNTLWEGTMSRKFIRSVPFLGLFAAALTWMAPGVLGQAFVGTPSPQQFASQGMPSTAKGEWPSYAGDVHGTRYSPLAQIDGSNFNKLEVAWRFNTDNFGPYPEWKLEGTPLMVNGVLYTTAGTRRAVIALDAKTGEQIWSHSLREGKRAAVSPRQLSGRGVSYWTDGKGDDRIVYVTTGYRLVELNAKSGPPIASFGKDGMVDLKVGAVVGKGQRIDLEQGGIA